MPIKMRKTPISPVFYKTFLTFLACLSLCFSLTIGRAAAWQPEFQAPWIGRKEITQGNHGFLTHEACGRRSTMKNDCTWENIFALDVGMDEKSFILAAADGTVYDAGPWQNSQGNIVALKHQGPGQQTCISVYLHVGEILVEIGQTVAQGQAIALIGEKIELYGSDFETHLHFHVFTGEPLSEFSFRTSPIERLIMKRQGVDPKFKVYGKKGKSLHDRDVVKEFFLSGNVKKDQLSRVQGQKNLYWLQNCIAYRIGNPELAVKMQGLPGWDEIIEYPSEALRIWPGGFLPDKGRYTLGPEIMGAPSDGFLLMANRKSKELFLVNGLNKQKVLDRDSVFRKTGLTEKDVIQVSTAVLDMLTNSSGILAF